MLLSMFFFFFARRTRTLVTRWAIAALSSCSFLCFAHGPPITRLHIFDRNTSHLARPRRDPPGVERAPPRGVTVFADRLEQPGASKPQKQRRHFPPSHRLWVHASHPHVSPAHAPSRRLQRVSFVCTHALRGQASRRRPTGARVFARAALRASQQPIRDRSSSHSFGITSLKSDQPWSRAASHSASLSSASHPFSSHCARSANVQNISHHGLHDAPQQRSRHHVGRMRFHRHARHAPHHHREPC